MPQPFREIKRRLEASGFAEISHRGSHVKFVRRLGQTVDTAIVPGKHEIPAGTLRSILSQAKSIPVTGASPSSRLKRSLEGSTAGSSPGATPQRWSAHVSHDRLNITRVKKRGRSVGPRN